MFGDGDDVGGGVGDGSVNGCLAAAAAADADPAANPDAPSDTKHAAGVDPAVEIDAAGIGGGGGGSRLGSLVAAAAAGVSRFATAETCSVMATMSAEVSAMAVSAAA